MSVRAQAPHWLRAHAWCRCCVQVYVHSACVSSVAHKGTLPLSRWPGHHSRTSSPPTTSHQPEGPTSMCRLGHSLPSWFHFCATRARSDAQDSNNCTAHSSHTLLAPGILRGKTAQFQGCPGSSDHPKSAVRSHLPNTALHESSAARRTRVPQTT